MTERERLTEREQLTERIRSAMRGGWTEPSEIAERLIDEGVICPPCKVGGTVYHYCETLGTVLPYFVEQLSVGFLDENRNYQTYEANCVKENSYELIDAIDFDSVDVGTYVFLTREEAEAALAERRKA